MPNYRRVWIPGGTYFFTVALHDRESDLLTRRIDDLRAVVASVKHRHPFTVHAH